MNHFKVSVLSLLTCLATSASVITYTEQATVSGSLGGTPFSSKLVTLALTGNTSSIMNPVSGNFEEVGTVTLTIAGIAGVATFTDSMFVFAEQGVDLAGIYDSAISSSVLRTENSGFASYNLSTPIGPLLGVSSIASVTNAMTTAGVFDITTADPETTFTATPAAVPEPSLRVLVAACLLLLALRRRFL